MYRLAGIGGTGKAWGKVAGAKGKAVSLQGAERLAGVLYLYLNLKRNERKRSS